VYLYWWKCFKSPLLIIKSRLTYLEVAVLWMYFMDKLAFDCIYHVCNQFHF